MALSGAAHALDGPGPQQAAAEQDGGEARRFDGYRAVRVRFGSTREYLAAIALAETTWSCEARGDVVDLVVSPENLGALRELGIEHAVLVENVQALIDAERAQIERANALRGAGYFDTFRTYDEVNARIDLLLQNNPGVVADAPVGTSRFARAIRGFAVSAPDSPGNPRDQRVQVLFNGTQHAREWISPTTVMFIADRLLADYGAGDPRVVALLQRAEVIFVPIVNPDGYVYSWTTNRMWRKTRTNNGNGTFGVDPNRNWGYEWGGEGSSGNGSSETYRGPSPFSEPETAALRDFIVARPRIAAHIDFHSYGQLILSPWGYTSALPPEPAQSVFARLNGDMAREVRSETGMTYVGGPAYTTIYPAAGTIPDWVFGDQNRLSWTIELRDTGANGFVLTADQIEPTGREAYRAVLTLLDYVALPLRFTFPDGLPSVVEEGQATDVLVVIDSNTRTANASTAVLLSRTSPGAALTETPLTPLGADRFLATLPAGACGGAVEFAFRAQNDAGEWSAFPIDAPASLLSSEVVKTLVSMRDPCEVNLGWTVGAPTDTATTGIWELAEPQQTAAQPGQDVSPDGTRCWVTGAAGGSGVGSFDVDGGATTLTSYAFSAVDPGGAPVQSAVLSYYLWYSNDRGANPAQDPFYVFISNDDGQTWMPLQVIPANGSTNAWVRFDFELVGLIEPTDRMRVRFVADDAGAGSIVEAAVDELTLVVRGCPPAPCAADFDGQNGVDVGDIFAFLAAWFAGQPGAYDFGGTPGVPAIFAFLSAWFAGC
jgi:murein tripeptide amidase MpaA